MKTLRHILTWLQATMMLGILSACHDDFQSPEPIPDANIDTGISIRIPNLDATTRSETWNVADPVNNKAPLADEGKILSEITIGDKTDKDSWLFIYYAEDGKTPAQNYAKGSDYNKAIWLGALEPLPTFDTNGNKKWYGASKSLNVEGSSSEVKVPMHPGKYKIYLVANVHQYLGDETLYTEEDETGNLIPIEEDYLKAALMTFNSGTDFGNQILKPGYLPMLCQPADVEEAATNGGVFNILDQSVTDLHCNMEFLCAKVRYTVLFDNNDFSKAEFGTRLLSFPDLSKAVEVSNIASECKMTGTYTPSSFLPSTTGSSIYGELKSINYPANPDESLEPGTGTDPDPAGKLAWQGIVYLPENTSTTSRTKLTFNSDATDGTTTSANPYEVSLITGGKQDGTAADAQLLRGHFYDLCIKATTLKQYELNFTVKDWDIQQIVYDLHGPYFLEVGDTENVAVESSEPTYIYYDTNADKLDFKSATYKRGDQEIPIYDFKEVVINGQRMIRISINGAISAKEGKIITDATNSTTDPNKDSYNYFHIIAGNIAKKINVKPLSITTFLDVDPGVININVREQKSSGIYSGAFPVTVKTNFDEYTITATNWKEVTSSEKNDSELMYLAYKDANNQYQRIEFGVPRQKPASGTDQLYLVYTGLNDESGSEFWSRFDHYLKLTVNAKSEDGTTATPKTVKINTKRASDNYIIYLRAEWTNPHIYVYQCLSFPMDAAEDRAGKSLATGSDCNTAALEYSFTGKLAFKGWNVGTYNSTDGELGEENGFKYFKKPSSTWDPKSDTGQHYFTDYDFCQEYRQSYYETGDKQHMKCEHCAKSTAATDANKWGGYNKLWPGIMMEEVTLNGKKWWRFELTPVATPGKALIMFSDGHDANDKTNRYPLNNKVGVPLFGFTERTGWFDYQAENKYFQSSDPYEEIEEEEIITYKYRIYWQRNYDTGDNQGAQNRDYIYFYNTGDPSLDNKCFERTGSSTEGASFMNYYDFESSILPVTMNQNMGFIARQNSNNWNNQSGDNKVSAFTKQTDGVWKSWNQTLNPKP